MTVREDILNFIKYQFEEHCGRTIGIAAGFVIAVSILAFGFFTTLFVAVCMGLGFYIGSQIDKNSDFSDDFLYKIQKFLPPYSRRW